MKLVSRASTVRARPALTMGHLTWRLAAHRRAAIRNVERALAALTRLRGLYDDAGLDEMLAEYRSILAIVRSLDPARPAPAQDLQDVRERLEALQRRLDAPFGPQDAAAGRPPGGAPLPGGEPPAD